MGILKEALAIRNDVGLIDATVLQAPVTGPGATNFLDWFTNKLPRVGQINLSYALTSEGTIRSEYTILRKSDNTYYLVSAGAWTDYEQII